MTDPFHGPGHTADEVEEIKQGVLALGDPEAARQQAVGPSIAELRAAGIKLHIAATMAPFNAALQQSVPQQTYLVEAQTMGVDQHEAQRILQEVIDELSATAAKGDPYGIARHRIAEGVGYRPPEELREAARQILAAGGHSLHPEIVDGQARRLQRLMVAYAPARSPWYARLWRRVRRILRRPTS